MTNETMPVLKATTRLQYYVTRQLARAMLAIDNGVKQTRRTSLYQTELVRQFYNRVIMAIVHEGKQITRDDVVSMLVRYQMPSPSVNKLDFNTLAQRAKGEDLFTFDEHGLCHVTETTKELIAQFRRYYATADKVQIMMQELQFMACVIFSGVGFNKNPAESTRQLHIAMYNGEWINLRDHCEDIDATFGPHIKMGIYVEHPSDPGFYQFSAKAMDILTAPDPNEA